MSRFTQNNDRFAPQGSTHGGGPLPQVPAASAPKTVSIMDWRGNIRGDNTTVNPGSGPCVDRIEGIVWPELGSSGHLVDATDRGQQQGHPTAPDGSKSTIGYTNPPGAPYAFYNGDVAAWHGQLGTQTGSGVWTWEGWTRHGSTGRGVLYELGSTAGGDHSVQLIVHQGNGVALDMQNNTPAEVLNTGNLIPGFPVAWHHWAICKNGTSWSLWWDGEQIGSGTGVTEGDINTIAYLGQTPDANYHGPMRLSRVERYTAPFTPPKQYVID